MSALYIPKGGMCSVCVNRFRNCANLPFSSMPVLQQPSDKAVMAGAEDIVVVKCTNFMQGTPHSIFVDPQPA